MIWSREVRAYAGGYLASALVESGDESGELAHFTRELRYAGLARVAVIHPLRAHWQRGWNDGREAMRNVLTAYEQEVLGRRVAAKETAR